MKFQKNKNGLLAVMLVLTFATLMTGKGYAENCDFAAVLAKGDHLIANISDPDGDPPYPEIDFDDPEDFYYDFVKLRSFYNPSGYGIIYYEDGVFTVPESQRYYSEEPYPQNPDPLENAHDDIINPDNNAVIVLGHDRTTTQGAPGNHPFWFHLEGVGGEPNRSYTFQHNGDCSYLRCAIYNYLGDDWFIEHPSNWGASNWDEFIDSELLFHFIMAHVIDNNGDVIGGIMSALNETSIYDPITGNYLDFSSLFESQTYIINFVLSDGEALYIFRNSSISGHSYNIEYKVNDNGFVGVKTRDEDDTVYPDISPLTLVYIPRNLDIITFDDIFSNYGVRYVSGTLENVNTWLDDIYIIGNLELPGGATLDIETGANVYFTGRHNFTVNGEVNLYEGAGLHLSHHSAVTIDGENALFFLDWGSTITGANPSCKCACCPGDRIIAKNGGRITTREDWEYDDYVNSHGEEPPAIEIYSRSADRWFGIAIKDPDPINPYWFVNCDISGINGINMWNTVRSKNGYGKLNLYYTDYHDCNPIGVRDIELLTIIGLDIDHLCNISNNHAQAVSTINSPVKIKYANIENNRGDGIYLAYTSSEPSKIDSSYFTGNGRNGIYINDSHLSKFNQNHIENNGSHGVYSRYGIFLNSIERDTIRNNGGTEFIGHQMSYHMEYGDNGIKDEDGNSGGWDQYILAALDWDGVNQIPVMGNDIPHGDETRFYPCFEAFDFGDDLSEIRQLLNSSFIDMNNQDYDNASITLNQLIDEYPESEEAVISVKCLYYIENYTDKNFTEFRDFLDTIQAEYGTAMYKVKEDVKTKTYMADADYLTAIERLEEIINNPPTPDDSIYAIIDEAYCYLKLSEDSTRAMPINCSVTPSNFTEYQETVRELESRLSFFNDIDYDSQISAPQIAMLHNNYPNPFNPITTISFSLADNVENAKIEIFNIKGQKIKTLVNSYLEKGTHNVVWNGTDKSGKKVVSGLYFYKLTTGKETAVKKMLLLR